MTYTKEMLRQFDRDLGRGAVAAGAIYSKAVKKDKNYPVDTGRLRNGYVEIRREIRAGKAEFTYASSAKNRGFDYGAHIDEGARAGWWDKVNSQENAEKGFQIMSKYNF